MVDVSYVREMASLIQARHLYTPMRRATSFKAEDDQGSTAEVMAESNFDYAPIVRRSEVVGFVARSDLTTSTGTEIADKVQRLTARVLVSGDAPVAELMTYLEDRPFLFVVEGREIAGLVTPSDLNKQPGRTYFYLLIANFEIAIAEMVRSRFPDQLDALRLISEARQGSVTSRLADLRMGDVDADVVAALDFTDLLTVVKNTPDLVAAFGEFSPGSWQRKVCGPLTSLRHDIMHGVRTLATDEPGSLDRLIRRDCLLRILIGL